MGSLRRITRASFTCLTAALLLLSGTPHLRCRCPDGHVKPFCLGSLLGSSCCGGTCCSETVEHACGEEANAAPQSGPACCCCAAPTEDPPEACHSRVESPCCARTPVASADRALTPTRAVVAGEHHLTTLLTPVSVPASSLALAPSQHRCLIYLLPPPTDLVTLLQHFLI